MSSIFFKRRLSARDYRIKIFRFAKRCQITLQDIITSSTWKGNFDISCIETMTQKTGRFMPFEMFFSLLLSSLRNSHGEAQLGVMTFRDLQNLFKEEVSQEVARQMDQENRRYFILTIRQPMITHYPLPLLFSREPDAELTAMTKHEMQTHLASEPVSPGCTTPRSTPGIRRTMKKKTRSEDARSQRSRKISFGKGDFLERVMGERIEQALNDSFAAPSPPVEANRDGETAAKLRMELRQQAREYKREMARLQRDNERLRRRIEEMKVREIELAADVQRMEERQRLNVTPRQLLRAHSASSATLRRRRSRPQSASSSASRLSHSPRAVRSMFNFFQGEQAADWAPRRRSSPIVSSAAPEYDRRLAAQARSKSLDDARGRCCRTHRCHYSAAGGGEGGDSALSGDGGSRPRRRAAGWVPFDPTEYVAERRRATHQRSMDRELQQRRKPSRRGRRPPAQPQQQQQPGWADVGDSAVVGMRQLESRLKNLQRMLAEKMN